MTPKETIQVLDNYMWMIAFTLVLSAASFFLGYRAGEQVATRNIHIAAKP